jgi:pimeloyl-ACP methyl ester carboxylesterase
MGLKTPIIMIHGAFCGGWAFDDFRRPFEAAGHLVITPDLPGHGRRVKDGVAGLSMSDYVKAVLEVIQAQSEPPILLGHSLGGLVAQMSATRTALAGLILLAPSAPWGVAVSSPEETLSALSLYALGPFWSLAIDPDRNTARIYLLDRLTAEIRQATFNRLAPESGRALFETLHWWHDPFATTLVSSAKVSAPVLGVAGEMDAIHPPATVRATTTRLRGEFHLAKGASHWLPAEPGWEDTAETCLNWIDRLALRAAA